MTPVPAEYFWMPSGMRGAVLCSPGIANPGAHTAIGVQRHAEGAYHMGVSSGPYNTLCQGGCRALLRAEYGPWYSGVDL